MLVLTVNTKEGEISMRLVDLTGQRFGRLTVLSRDVEKKGNAVCWLCLCDCGKMVVIRGGCLKSKNTQSCGCLNKEKIMTTNTTHGHRSMGGCSRTYRSYYNMINRCTNSNDKRYLDYGGRGITICQRWLDSFENFLEDMGECPGRLTIDRIDNDKGYEPGNCRWTTMKEQNRNRRDNKLTLCKANRIREFKWAGISTKDLAEQFNVHTSMISYICNNKSWA